MAMVAIGEIKNKGEQKMNAQKKAYSNYCHSFDNSYDNGPDGTTFAKPNPTIGYGQLLVAIATLPHAKRTSRKAINEALNKPTYPTTGSIHGVDNYNRLVRAKLIAKKNGIYSLTQLGKKYCKEMKLVA